MKLRLSIVLVLLAGLFAAAFVFRARAADQVFAVEGVVRAPLDRGRIVIAHQDIPGFMPAMTMAFAVARPAEAAALQVGDRVRFQLHVGETSSRVEALQPIGRETTSAAAPRAAVASHRRVRDGDAVPEFSLIDQDGVPLTTAALRGHFTVMTFIFTRCPVPEFCPAMALRFAALQKEILADPELASRVRLLSVSFDPEFDRPETLKAYGTAVGADGAIWRFATGEQAVIETLTKAFAVFVERGGVTLNHTLCTALIGPDGRVVSVWRGNGWKTDDVRRAIAGDDAARRQ